MIQYSFLPVVLLAQVLLGAPSIAPLAANRAGQPESDVDDTKDAYITDAATRKAIDKRIAEARAANTIRAAYADDKGNLWFTSNKGVHRYDGVSFTKLTTQDGLSDNLVTSIMQDNEGHMWFGVPDGLCKYDGESFTHIPVPYTEISSSWLDQVYPVVNPNQVMCMLQDRNGDLWIGTNGGGAYRYDGETFTSYLADQGQRQSDGLYHNVILEMTQDTKGNIWFTSLTRGGVSRFDGTSMRHFNIEDGLSDYMTRSIYADRSGNVWIGSNGNRKGGLDRFDGERFTSFNKSGGLDNTSISAIFEDSSGKIWASSVQGSLSTFDGERFTPLTDQSGNTFQSINFIIEDAHTNIWFGGNRGQLFRFDGKDVTDLSGMVK